METIETAQQSSFADKNKLFIKSIVIFVMAFVLWLTTFLIMDIIKERASRQKEAVADISSKWAGKQTITGPLLMVPYNETTADGHGGTVTIKKNSFFIPDKLNAQSIVYPEKRHRGIYEVAVYRTGITVSGKFAPLKWEQLKIQPGDILWNEAVFLFKARDPIKGLNEDLYINLDGKNILFDSQSSDQVLLPGAFTAPAGIIQADSSIEHYFTMKFNLLGSEQLLFTPLARENNISMNSTWPNPGFTGVKLPDSRDVKDSGFVANWKFMNRTIPTAWKNAKFDLTSDALGADLLIPVDNYDKTERSVKYALLCIILTFAAFFLVESIHKKTLHLVQYGIAGLALVLFYTLLLSISEYTGFNAAYGIAAIATIGLVTWYVGSIMHSTKLASFISFVLAIVYGYIFTIIQLQDYSLLMGSIGLFISLGIIMYFSRRLQWQNEPATALANNATS